jgi:predicted Zn-dependent peptidase
MNYNLRTLPTGLKLLTVPMPTSESVNLTVWVKTGSRNEEERILGISHFLEHMVFKGSKKYPTMRDLFEKFDAMGAEHNAGTTKEWTNFYVKLPVFDIERGFDILSDVVLRPILNSKEVERERKVIFEEIKMGEDMPMRNIADIFEELIYQGNPLGLDIIGNIHSLNKIKREDFINYRKKYYFGENMLISVAGGVKEEQILKLTKEYFSDVETKSEPIKKTPFKSDQKNPQVKVKNKKTDQAHFILGFPAAGRNYENKYSQAVLSTILGGGASSRLFTEVREKRGLAYAVSGAMDRYSDAGYFEVYTGCDIGKPYEAISVILDQCYGLNHGKYKVTKKELDKVKGYIKGHIALSLEDSENVNDFFSEQVLFDKNIYTPEEIFKKIDAVTIDEVYSEAKKLFVPSKLNLAIIGPFQDKEKFIKLLK